MTDGGEWVKILSGLDIGVMMAIAVIAWVLKRSLTLTEGKALLIPTAIGCVWGIIEATQNGYAPVYFVIKGALMNGGGATVVGRLLDETLARLIPGTAATKKIPAQPTEAPPPECKPPNG